MPTRLSVVIMIMIVICGLALVGCQKLPEQPKAEASFVIEQAATLDSIPRDYGDLISVTPSVSNPHWSYLWFQRPDQSIVVVRVNPSVGTMYDQIMTIPRR